jgi:hypothetical protein
MFLLLLDKNKNYIPEQSNTCKVHTYTWSRHKPPSHVQSTYHFPPPVLTNLPDPTLYGYQLWFKVFILSFSLVERDCVNYGRRFADGNCS